MRDVRSIKLIELVEASLVFRIYDSQQRPVFTKTFCRNLRHGSTAFANAKLDAVPSSVFAVFSLVTNHYIACLSESRAQLFKGNV